MNKERKAVNKAKKINKQTREVIRRDRDKQYIQSQESNK